MSEVDDIMEETQKGVKDSQSLKKEEGGRAAFVCTSTFASVSMFSHHYRPSKSV